MFRGLDTSIALAWLQRAYNADVVAFCANLGQVDDLSHVEARARKNGASAVYMDDLREEFIREYAFRSLRAGALYEGRYHMAASLGRPLIAKRLVEIAHMEGADAIAHGATGKGNDQVRFFSSVMALDPTLRVIAPVMEWDLTTRSKQIGYAAQYGIEIPAFKSSPYSRDSNLWGTSVECGELDDIGKLPPRDAYTLTADPDEAPHEAVDIAIDFAGGVPVRLDGAALSAAELVAALNRIGGAHGIGRLDIIENRLVGFKVRGVYESPAAEILSQAMRELENLVLDRDLLHMKTGLSQHYAELIYDGKWFSGRREALDAFFESYAHKVTGTIKLRLNRGRVTIVSRSAPEALYNLEISSYESDVGFDQTAGVGFSYIWSMQGRVAALQKAAKAPEPVAEPSRQMAV
ncbi:argininosuccinate synthase [Breoghania sp. L-A4]|uniref:argininosuccinate synthase n=1 Tax=Breoghania sp. L-A4 TaxID=2304600 RepID=UPI000E35C135|nr:argininosuccinate synthase [Breoghania sp. L-A4]AXS39946.1 argininosuccinate synthase [Breoghania sp. L-A4]